MTTKGIDRKCQHCGRPIFQEPDGTWNLVYREYDNTRVCDARGDGAVLSTLPHVPADLSDEQYELADQLEVALEAAGPAGLTPSQAARKVHATTDAAAVVLGWMVANFFVHTSGHGAWTHYHHGGRAR